MKTWTDFGISLPDSATGEVRSTCPECSESRRKSKDRCLAVNADKGTWVCWHCGWKGSLYGPLQAGVSSPTPRPPVQPDERKRAALRRVWGEARPLTAADPVDTYIRQRGIALPLADLPAVLRYHAHLVYRHDDSKHTYHPAMVARVDNAQGQSVSLHRTYLTIDGHKAAVPTVKKLMPSVIPGATGLGKPEVANDLRTLMQWGEIRKVEAGHYVRRAPQRKATGPVGSA